MSRVIIVGCGVIGAAIAYELSAIAGLDITVLDRQHPAQGSTGAALGILMGAVSQKTKGRAWMLRQLSLQTYDRWVPELEAITGQSIPFNRQGLVLLTFDDDDLEKWQTLQTIRQDQGWSLEIWDQPTLRYHCPLVGQQLTLDDTRHTITGAIYSPQDRQIDPKALTHALVTASKNRGVQFHFEAIATSFHPPSTPDHPLRIDTTTQSFEADWIILAAGLGTTPLTQTSPAPLDIRPVLGQAIQLQLPDAIAAPFQPVITGKDIHIVPVGDRYYWVGATVEFPDEAGIVSAEAARLQEVLNGAIALYPPLAQGVVVEQWSGLRPRPFGRPAPIVEPLAGRERVILATGHYRNGVLLAPATAHLVRNLILEPN